MSSHIILLKLGVNYEGLRADALALATEEGRGQLRKAVGSCKQALIRRYPNGETRYAIVAYRSWTEYIGLREGTQGTEPSKYLKEKKINNDSHSSGERIGKSLNQSGVQAWQRCLFGVVGSVVQLCQWLECWLGSDNLSCLERHTQEGESPVDDIRGATYTDTRVLRDPGKPAGISVDHHVRLNIV